MAENKLVKTVTDSAVLIGLSAGMGWLVKKALRESIIGDPTTNIMNYVKWVGLLTIAIYVKKDLEDRKILPTSV